MAAEDLEVDFGADAVVLSDDNAEAAQHVFKCGHTLLDVVFAVHAELGSAAAGRHGDGLVGAGFHESGSFDQSVGRACAEAAAVGAGSGDETCDLGCGLGKVAAAALVHIAAGLFAAVNDVLHVGLFNTGIVDAGEQGQNGRGLGDDVLVHNVGGEVNVDVMGAFDAADQDAVVVQAFGVLVVDKVLDLAQLKAVLDAGDNALVDHGVRGEGGLVGGDKVLVQQDKVKHISGLHEEQELLLGHHLAEVAVAFGHVTGSLIEGLRNGGQFIRGLVADVNLVRPVLEDIFPAADVRGELFQIVAFGVDDHLGGLGGTVMQNHVRNVAENVAGAFDNTFHFCIKPLLKFNNYD